MSIHHRRPPDRVLSQSGEAETLGRYVAAIQFSDIPSVVVQKAKQHILDLFGVSLLGRDRADSSPAIRSAVLSIARRGDVSVWGEPFTLAPAHAALLNGVYAHSMDFDDTHLAGSVHPGATAIPTALAIAERNKVSGARLITGVVTGYEVTCRVALALGARSHYELGFHPTATAGVFGATSAAAAILGLSSTQLVQAFGINGSQAAGTMQFLSNGGWNKRLHPGIACHNAIFAIELALQGFVGAASPFDGKFGFLRAHSQTPRPELLTNGLGDDFEIMRTAIKPYPACQYAHDPITSILELVLEHDLEPIDIQSITIRLPRTAIDLIGSPAEEKRNPRNVVDGQFSMHFLAAVAVFARRVNWEGYKSIGDPRLGELMNRIDVVPSSQADLVFPEEWLSSVEITTTQAVRSRERRSAPTTAPDLPTDFPYQKFQDTARSTIGEEQARRLAHLVDDLDRLKDVSVLGQALRKVGGACNRASIPDGESTPLT